MSFMSNFMCNITVFIRVSHRFFIEGAFFVHCEILWSFVDNSTVNIKFRGRHKIGARNSEHQVAAVATVAEAPGNEGFHGQPGGQLLYKLRPAVS